MDNSDQQYAGFRNNVPYLILLLVLHPLLRKAYEHIYPSLTFSNGDVTSHEAVGKATGRQGSEADDRLARRVSFDLYFAILYIFALHGSSAFKILLILYINYTLATKLGKEYVPATTWMFNIGVLFANEIFKGYPFAGIAGLVSPWSVRAGGSGLHSANHSWGTYLDSYSGLLPRWEILFNITVLRLISFNLDYIWSLQSSESSALEVCDNNSAILTVAD